MTPSDLKSFRKSLGLSQAEFARAVGVASDRTVRKWESGERDIPGHVEVLVYLTGEEMKVISVRLALWQRAQRAKLGER